MKNKAGMWFILAIGGAIGLLIATAFAYYSRKYEDQFSCITEMDPMIRVREVRVVVNHDKLNHYRIYESDKPVWFYSDEAIKANPKTNLVTSQIRKDAEKGGGMWLFAQFKSAKPPYGVFAQISNGIFLPGRHLDKYRIGSFPDGINRSIKSKTTLIIMAAAPLDPLERIAAACGFYR